MFEKLYPYEYVESVFTINYNKLKVYVINKIYFN